MIRKLFLELRWIFPILPLFLIAVTVEYTWIAQRTWILAAYDGNSFSLQMLQNPPKPEDYQKVVGDFLKEYPRGQVISLKEKPLSYFAGFDGMARTFLPFLVIFLCGGGILCEKTNGTASFVLSLPASRSSWLWSRAAALCFLTFVTALLACTAAFILATQMGIHQSAGWIFRESILLTLEGAGWIGVSLFLQSLLAGRFDTTAETLITIFVGCFLAFATFAFLSSANTTTRDRIFEDPFSWYIAPVSYAAISWTAILITNVVGMVGLLLATRRFERMDF